MPFVRPHFAILPTQLALLPPQACSRSVSRMSRRWRSLRRRAPTPAQARCSVDERELVRVSPLGALTQRQSHQCLCSFAQVQPRTSILHGRDRVRTSDAGACICSRHASPRAPPSRRLRPAQALPPTLVLLVQARRRHRPRRRAAALNATVKLNAATTLDANAALDVTAALDANAATAALATTAALNSANTLSACTQCFTPCCAPCCACPLALPHC